MARTKTFDMAAYIERATKGPCFICEIVAGNPDYPHHIIHEDEQAIVFLNAYPMLYGYALVAPRQHREQVTGDFSQAEYLQLQTLIYRVSEAVRQVVPTERVYLLSLGSRQGNSHVHWHIAPLPPGVPFLEQQLEALQVTDRILDLSDEEMSSLAVRIRAAMALDKQPIDETRAKKLWIKRRAALDQKVWAIGCLQFLDCIDSGQLVTVVPVERVIAA